VSRVLNTPVGVLFDLDGTIIDHAGAAESSLQQACTELASRAPNVSAEDFRSAFKHQARRFWTDPALARSVAQGRSDVRSVTRAIFEAALVDVGIRDAGLARGLADRYRDRRDAGMRLVPDAVDTLAGFRARWIRLALVTNGGAATQRMKIDRFELGRWFDYILVEGEFGAGKPDRSVYEAAVRALGCLPTTAWMVGDDLRNDVAAPQQLGISGIWVDPRDLGLPPESPVTPDRIVRSIRDLDVELRQFHRSTIARARGESRAPQARLPHGSYRDPQEPHVS
jgi:putative hydrolase of the HAD superfamily